MNNKVIETWEDLLEDFKNLRMDIRDTSKITFGVSVEELQGDILRYLRTGVNPGYVGLMVSNIADVCWGSNPYFIAGNLLRSIFSPEVP